MKYIHRGSPADANKCKNKQEAKYLYTMYVLYYIQVNTSQRQLDKYEGNSRHASVQHTTQQRMSGVIMKRGESAGMGTGMEYLVLTVRMICNSNTSLLGK